MLSLLLKSIKALMCLPLSLFFWCNCIRYWAHKIYLRVISLLVSVIRLEVDKTNISFLNCPVFSRFKIVLYKMLFFIIVVINSLNCIFLISIIVCSTGGVNCIDINSQGAKVLSNLCLVVVFLFFLLYFLVRGFTYKQAVWWF